MTTLNWVPRVTGEFSVSVTPAVTNVTYSAGFQVGGVMTLTDVIRNDQNLGYGTSKLTDITIFIKNNVSPALEILFFRNSPTMTSANNQSFNISNANAITAGYLGRAALGSSFTTSGSSSGANINTFTTDANLNITLKKLYTETLPTTVFAVMKTTASLQLLSSTDILINFNGLID